LTALLEKFPIGPKAMLGTESSIQHRVTVETYHFFGHVANIGFPFHALELAELMPLHPSSLRSFSPKTSPRHSHEAPSITQAILTSPLTSLFAESFKNHALVNDARDLLLARDAVEIKLIHLRTFLAACYASSA